ncbi:MAG TPA: cytochrome b [Steroidobacteraceae bacterium]|nr:cytochrome b [Steroidobacteraceae bacterium]
MKQLRDQVATHYTTVAVILHWLIALALIGQIAFGWFLDSVPRGTPARGFYVNLHKSTGLTLAVLIVARVAWRLAHRPPPLPALMRPWERDAAQWSHAALYACMIGMPLSGYIASNFSKYGVKLFNVLTLPPWGVDDAQTYSIFNTTHVVLSYVFVALIVVHILAALKHAIARDGVFSRMSVSRTTPSSQGDIKQ